MFGRKKHKHEWHDVLAKEVSGFFNIKRNMYIVYCPICDKRRELEQEEWNIIKNAQKIRDAYLEDIKGR